MNVVLKAAVVAAIFGSAAASANTLVDPGTTGTQTGGDLVLLVTDNKGGTLTFYTYDTGTPLDSVITVAGVASLQPTTTPIKQTAATGTLAFSTIVNVGPNLAAFLNSDPTKSDFIWQIFAGDTATQGGNTKGSGRLLFSSSAPSITTQPTSSVLINTGGGNVLGMVTNVNGATQTNDTNTSFGYNDTSTPGQAATSGYYNSGVVSGAALGSAQTLYVLAGSGLSSRGANIFATTGTFTLGTDGTLTFSGGSPPPVPIPAAIWLLGSGLLGLVGVSRRRRA
jgi:hypothetical protein